MLELEELLAPLGQGAPAGPDLRDSPAYAELERAIEGKPERQAGSKIVPAEPPDWKDIRTRCVGILKVSKDLRVAILLARARLEVDGYVGFEEGLRLILGLIEGFWDSFHPQLDADEGADATARVSAMTELTQRGVIQALRAAPLAAFGPFPAVSLRSIEQAAVVRPPPAPPKPGAPPAPAATVSSPAPSAASIDAVFQQAPIELLSKTGAGVTGCAQSTQQITTLWADRLPGAGPDFTELRRVLYQADQTVKTRLEARGGARAANAANATGGAGTAAGAGAAAGAVAGPAAASGAPAQPVPTAPTPGFSGEIQSREDVLRSIDAICAYYARSEPSSPVPLILQRGKRLVTMSFGEILKELLPESLPNMQKISGKTD
jgi:type VI secretion system protein ImpA